MVDSSLNGQSLHLVIAESSISIVSFVSFRAHNRAIPFVVYFKGAAMSAQKIVHLPTAAEVEQAKLSSRTLSKYADVDRVQLSLRGSNGETDELVLPGHVLQILLDVLAEVSQGNAISLIPYHQEISTQDAANLLNVSRPFLVRLLESGDIPFRKVGAHRRVKLQDVLSYKEHVDRQRHATLDELAELSQDEGMGY